MGQARSRIYGRCASKVNDTYFYESMRNASRNCVGCKQKLVGTLKQNQLREDLGHLAHRLSHYFPELPLCEECYNTLLQRPRRATARQKRHKCESIENVWCENCFISTKKSDTPPRFFGSMRFCEHCSSGNDTRWRKYLKIAALMDRTANPQDFRFLKPTYNKSCAECPRLLGPGGSFHEKQFYCAKHSPLIFGLPPARILARLKYSDIKT